jgi:hypothetical protein
MKWYYIWSEKYIQFHKYLQEAITDAGFEACPIYISQERFSKELYQQFPDSPWAGCNIKVLEIIKILKDGSEGEGFMFTDVDIYIRDKCNAAHVMALYDSFPELEMVFSPEGGSLQIGSMFLRAGGRVLAFWENILELCMQNPQKTDQTIIKEEIASYPPDAWKIFPPEHVLNCHNIAQPFENKFLIFNLMTNNSENQENDIEHKREEFNFCIEYLICQKIIGAENRRHFIPLRNGDYLKVFLPGQAQACAHSE